MTDTTKLLHHPYALSVCKLTQAVVPQWAQHSPIISFTCTPDETSLVCASDQVNEDDIISCDDGWQCISIDAVMDFALVGIIARITTILADEAIAVFVISTFNTDYILIKEHAMAEALAVLSAYGYRMTSA